jgi:hypothetical protein
MVEGRPGGDRLSRWGRVLPRTPVPEGSGPFAKEESAAAGELEPVMERRIPPVGVQARRAEAGSQVHQLYGVPYTAREYCRSAGLIRVDCLRSLLTGLLRGPWTHQLLGFLQAVGHHALSPLGRATVRVW